MALTLLGALGWGWMVYGLISFPSRAFIEHHSIAYRNPVTGNFLASCLYIVATCGALMLSTHDVVRWYGVLNVIGNLRLALNSSMLPAGGYELRIEGLTWRGEAVPLSRVQLVLQR